MSDDEQPTSRWNRIDPIAVVVVAIVAILAIVGGLVLVTRPADQTALAGHHMYPAHVTPRAETGQITVDVGDYWFKPSTHRVRAGVYRFSAHNYGVVQHDVMVERMPIKMMGPGQPVDEAAPYGVDGLMPGMTMSTKVMLTAGRWEVFCSLTGHYRSGQHQIITVYGHMPPGMRAPRSMGMDDDNDGMGAGMMGSS